MKITVTAAAYNMPLFKDELVKTPEFKKLKSLLAEKKKQCEGIDAQIKEIYKKLGSRNSYLAKKLLDQK